MATTASVSRVIDPAEPSAVPISPKTAMIMLLALIMGMVLPVVVIFIAEALRTKIYSTEEVEDMLPADIPIVGAIPAKPNKNSSDIMVTPNSRDSIAEAFRMVRTNIDFMLPVGGKVIMTTSTVPSEGKTTCALNIALSFAITGKKVIIVDMDMRKGSMEKRIGSTHYPQGIVNYLVGKESDLDKLIVKNCVHGVDALFVGTIPPNPAELVMRKELDEVIEKLKDMYDYIIIDTAPIALVTDTMLANRLADVTLYCMRMGHTDKTVFETLRAITIRQSLKNMGVIISEVGVGKLYYGGEKTGTGFGYGYGYGYGYGHKDEDTKKTIITRLLKLLKKDK
ncbi:MAG: polysaccharide biosynthesis tyrosine autokinase [Tidjanibacter sp.]|nr:polysaccharide biosynthesis tyrosine autokinase [Tidjanibacter sp.]